MKRAKVVLDITSDATEGGVLKGLDRAALILNLYAQAGIERDEGVALAIVLHGKATPFALSDEAYKKRHPDAAKNPNLELIRDLKKHGATVYVCAQSLARNGYAKEDVASEITVATSAIIANINLQNQGYACVPFH
jgi:intracellular sulfur oxidation DsrE/DsrF family protein